jgi:hypothetical protein
MNGNSLRAIALFAAILLTLVAATCQSPEGGTSPSPTGIATAQPSPVVANPSASPNPMGVQISKEEYDATFDAIKAFVKKMNDIIQRKDYDAWTLNLTKAYILRYSDKAYLAELSQKPVLKANKITLESLKDYFLYVVVPSREEYNVQDIEFISKEYIKVFAVNKKNDRLLLYYLEKEDNVWKIGLGR